MWTVSGTLWCFLQRRHLLIKSLFVLMKIVKLLKQNKKQLQGNVYPTVCAVKAAVCCVMRRQFISMKLNYLYYQYCENYVLQVYKNTGLIQNCDIRLNLRMYAAMDMIYNVSLQIEKKLFILSAWRQRDMKIDCLGCFMCASIS